MEDNMEKLLIIDSESLMKRAFYAIPNMSNEESLYTNAIYGFTKMLFHIKKKIRNRIHPLQIFFYALFVKLFRKIRYT